jgi:hypothetical protein
MILWRGLLALYTGSHPFLGDGRPAASIVSQLMSKLDILGGGERGCKTVDKCSLSPRALAARHAPARHSEPTLPWRRSKRRSDCTPGWRL